MRNITLAFIAAAIGCASTLSVTAQRVTNEQRSVAVAAADSPFPSALLVAERTENGVGVSLYPSGQPTPGVTPRFFPFENPTAIAEAGGDLYAWDEGNDALVAVNLATGEQRVLWRGAPFDDPTQISVSPDRVIAIFDDDTDAVYWLTTDLLRKFSLGNDDGKFQHDGECNDRRFQGEGMAPPERLDADGLHRDASDCRQLVLRGKITLLGGQRPFGTLRASDFGDNESDVANDGECDDPRFTGPSVSNYAKEYASVTDLAHDAADCKRLFELGEAAFMLTADRVSRTGQFGDDDSEMARNEVCNDPRFTGAESAFAPDEVARGHDATDCARRFNAGEIDWVDRTLPQELVAQQNMAYGDVDFGTDGANLIDGECDDPRFVGPGMAVWLYNTNIGGDRTDCETLFEEGSIQLLDALDQSLQTVNASEIDFGDDTSTWAEDGECDDPRFYGEGSAMTLLGEDEGHDATDCRELYDARKIRLRAADAVRLASSFATEVTGIGRVPPVADPIGAVFASADTLAVLDGASRAIFQFKFNPDYNLLGFRADAAIPLVADNKLDQLRAIASRDGLLYVADENNVYTYVAAERRLVPAFASPAQFDHIRQLAAGRDQVFVLSDKPLDPVLRTVPVQVVLEATPEVDQATVVDLLAYLASTNLLEWRSVRAERAVPTVEQFLVEQKVWVAALGADNAKRPLGDVQTLAAQFCGRNAGFCGRDNSPAVFGKPVPRGTELQLPSIELASSLQVETIELQGSSIEDYFRRRVVSTELRTEFYESIQRINRSLAKTPIAELPRLKPREALTLAFETWSLTVTVPREDYIAKSSALWRWAGRPGIGVYSRESYGEKSALTPDGQPPPPPPPPSREELESARLCEALKVEHDNWYRAMEYPVGYPPLATSNVPVGVLEKTGQLLKSHWAFALDDSIAWHTPARIGELAPEPVPQSGVARNLRSISRYAVATDHGTHVASLIGGRKDSCWSGLLPQARLVHIDVTDQALTRAQVSNARRSRTKVFNVSQQLGADSAQDDAITFLDNLRNWMVVEFKDVLFVAAAGNSGRDLNTSIGMGYPAGFGESENVVTVTALGAGHDVLGTHETDGVTQRGGNFGKRVVDLAAPGTKIIAATGQQMFGSATGTSQAAPAVAAAAAFVIDAAEIDVGDAKARLIAAAKWYPDLKDDVWGGEFSFLDTVLMPGRDVLQTATGGGQVFVLAGAKKDAVISIDNRPTLYARGGGAAGEAVTQLPFDNILSLRLDAASDTYRVVYKDPASNRLVITLDAKLSGAFECEQLMLLDVATEGLSPEANGCTEPMAITQVTKFIRHLPYHVEW